MTDPEGQAAIDLSVDVETGVSGGQADVHISVVPATGTESGGIEAAVAVGVETDHETEQELDLELSGENVIVLDGATLLAFHIPVVVDPERVKSGSLLQTLAADENATTLTASGLNRFNAVQLGDMPHRLVLGTPPNHEVIYIVQYNGTGTTATVLRGREGTTPQEWPAS